ncbi:hypothetical protein M2318_002749 [Metapseudomonas resinovorans]|uniref:hypothetical protein n=1 Tax=Metapseudomonas resinovorans TaxID=53412 RepID=UPI003D20C74D
MNKLITAVELGGWKSVLLVHLRTARETPYTFASDNAFYTALGMISAARMLRAIDADEEERLDALALSATLYRCREINGRMPLYTYRPTPTIAQEQSA